ncbi:MAG TPA: hypothetical protein PLT68_05860 [Actinomycetota bacterium]|nr:hypothetical protein [Actinomycetota bacterium]
MRAALILTAAVLVATAGCSGSADDAGASASPSPAVSDSASQAVIGEPVGKPNGIGDLSPAQILDKAGKAALSARSVHLIGTSPQTSLDLVVTQDSSDGTRTAGDVTLQTRVVDGVIYLKADQAYWTQAFNAKIAAKIGNKWVAGELSNPKLKTFKETSTMGPLMKQFLVSDESAQVGQAGVAQGQPAVPLTGSIGTLWVASTGKPYPLLLTSSPDQPEASQVEFTEWDKKVVITAPPKKQTISLVDLA